MKTRGGIYNNLNESDYIFKINGLVFYFSSQVYLNKFKEKIQSYINNETIKIKNKYKVKINIDCFLMISLYKQIEKRGFRVFDEISKNEITRNVDFINTIISY